MNIQAISRQFITVTTESIRHSLSQLDKRVLLAATVIFAGLTLFFAYKYWSTSQALKAALFTGHGNFTTPSGDVIDGEFEHGALKGHAKVIRENGEIWDGEFRGNMMEGPGEKHFIDGTQEQGIYKAGILIKKTMPSSPVADPVAEDPQPV